MGEFQQKLLDEASALDLTQLQMFTRGLHDHDRGASALHHCQAKEQDELAEDSFFKGGPTPYIHDALMELPLHGELQTDLEKAIQDNSSAVFQKIKWGVPTDSFSSAIPLYEVLYHLLQALLQMFSGRSIHLAYSLVSLMELWKMTAVWSAV